MWRFQPLRWTVGVEVERLFEGFPDDLPIVKGPKWWAGTWIAIRVPVVGFEIYIDRRPRD